VIANWADVPAERIERGHICSTWRDLGEAAGTERVGVNRVQVEPGRWSSPVHAELDAEEIFFVLAGSGVSFQNGLAYDVRAGDCIVHRVADTHGLRAGDDGIDVLAFGERINAHYTHFPRVQVIGNYPGVTLDVSTGPRVWDREVAAGEPELPEVSANPGHIVNAHTTEAEFEGEAGRWVRLARSAGAVRTGLNWARLGAGRAGAPPHCHSAEEEIFVVLEGGGTLELWPSPQSARAGGADDREEHTVRAGDVVSRPAGTRIAHYLRAGDDGMTFLAYGQRDPNDVCYYPRSNKIFWRGVGLIARLESLEYDDGEPED
jgi:uncharacterized cupin superfamily protein